MVLDAYTDIATFSDFIRDADGIDAAVSEIALEAAARAIDAACGRTFRVAAATATARYFDVQRPYVYSDYTVNRGVVPIDDVFDLTGMEVLFDVTGNGDYTGTAVTAYRAGPANASARQMPYTRLMFDSGTYPPSTPEGVKVTALWGWDAIPTTIVQANMIQAARFLKRRDAPFGVAGSPDMGTELRLLSKLDPDVALMVGAYKRNWGAV